MSTIKTAHGTVHISDNNRKVGETPSFSLPAIFTCRKNAPCFKECYATQGTFAWDSVQHGYWENYYLCTHYPEEVREALIQYLKDWIAKCAKNYRKAFFRWMVSGDVYSRQFLEDIMIPVIEATEVVNHLDFTKQYEIWNEYLDEGAKPCNLSLMYSKWYGLDIPNPHNMPTTHVIYEDGFTTAHEGYHLCPGQCATCQTSNRGCWAACQGDEVAFHIHGPRLKYCAEAQERNYKSFVQKLANHAKEWGFM